MRLFISRPLRARDFLGLDARSVKRKLKGYQQAFISRIEIAMMVVGNFHHDTSNRCT